MSQNGRYHGGLVFYADREGALDRFSRIVTATLEDYGHPVERQSLIDNRQGRIVSSHYLVKLTLNDMKGNRPAPKGSDDDQGKALQRLVIDLCPVAPGADDRDVSELLLVVTLYRMVDIVSTRSIEWLDPQTVLTIEQFLGAFTNVSPRRIRGRQQVLELAGVPQGSGEPELYDAQADSVIRDPAFCLTQEEELSLAYRFSPRVAEDPRTITPEEEAQNDIRRLATWGMTGMVAFLSGPVAVSLAAVNLAKGEDFRLNTHVLSLTGLLVMLQSTGALASAVSYLPL